MLLRRAFDIIELLALGGTYTDQAQDPAGSTFLTQCLAPVRVPLQRGPAPDTFTTSIVIAKQVIGNLLAATAPSDTAPRRWAPLKVLALSRAARISERPDGRHDIVAPGLRDLIFTPLVGVPLAVYPFFHDPFDPLGHFALYLRDYFPEITRDLTGANGGRALVLVQGAERLRLWTDHARLYADMANDSAGTTGVAIKLRSQAVLSVRVRVGDGPQAPVSEDLSAVSCRDTGAYKRTWSLAPNRIARLVASDRKLSENAVLLDAGCRPAPDLSGVPALFDAAERTP
jgi:hypothetical protein